MFARGKDNTSKASRFKFRGLLFWGSLIFLAINVVGVKAFVMPSGSMAPTIMKGDHFLVLGCAYGIKSPLGDQTLVPLGDPQRGDVVLFLHPEGTRQKHICRVIGLPGETVQLRFTQVLINGAPLDDPWGRHLQRGNTFSGAQPVDNFGPVVVPPDHYFVMGDNRDQSYDSRLWFNGQGGFLPKDHILGKVVLVHWSRAEDTGEVRWDRVGRLVD